jgi:hypothetical protein
VCINEEKLKDMCYIFYRAETDANVFDFVRRYTADYTVDFFFEEMFIFDTSNQSNLFSFDMPFTINFIYSRTVCFSNMCTISSCYVVHY